MSIQHSENVRMPWLSALVAFEAAARLKSLKLAAIELNLTPGAISRQIKGLEQSLDVLLFSRRNNAIELTDYGRAFLVRVTAGLAEIRAGAKELSEKASVLTIRGPVTLTQRWLIPRIEGYKRENPNVDLRFRTINATGSDSIDVEIKYARGEPASPDGLAEPFLLDTTAPVGRRGLSGTEAIARPEDVLALPILQDTGDGWSWLQWTRHVGIPFVPKRRTMVFDTDEAAIDACLSGLGVAQVNTCFIAPLLRDGSLCRLWPDAEPVIGAYYAVSHTSSRVVKSFVTWLKIQGAADAAK